MKDDSGTASTVGIREVAETTGLSIDTLRWYERQGLLPLVERDSRGRRRYSPAALNMVHLVAALRRTGMPVEDVRGFVALGSGRAAHERRGELLERHAAAVERQLAQLQEDLTVVRRKIAHHHELGERGVVCEDLLPSGAARVAKDAVPEPALAAHAAGGRE